MRARNSRVSEVHDDEAEVGIDQLEANQAWRIIHTRQGSYLERLYKIISSDTDLEYQSKNILNALRKIETRLSEVNHSNFTYFSFIHASFV